MCIRDSATRVSEGGGACGGVGAATDRDGHVVRAGDRVSVEIDVELGFREPILSVDGLLGSTPRLNTSVGEGLLHLAGPCTGPPVRAGLDRLPKEIGTRVASREHRHLRVRQAARTCA